MLGSSGVRIVPSDNLVSHHSGLLTHLSLVVRFRELLLKLLKLPRDPNSI